MNKKTIITILLALVTVTGLAQTKNYTIQGNLSEVAKATAKQGVSFDSVTIVNTATNEVTTKCTIQDGVFTIKGTIDKSFCAISASGPPLKSMGIERVRDPDYPLSSSLATSCLMATTRCL